MALRAADQILARNIRIVKQNLAVARRFFENHARELLWHEPSAGSVMFPGWNGAMTLDELCRRAIEEHGVMMVPASVFNVSSPHFRLGLGRVNLPQGLAKFEALLGDRARHRDDALQRNV